MRTILLSALFALGLGLAGSTGAMATPNATMIDKLANSTSIVQKAYCRAWRIAGGATATATAKCIAAAGNTDSRNCDTSGPAFAGPFFIRVRPHSAARAKARR